MIDEAKTKGAKVHFTSLMDMCHFDKMLSWRQSTKKKKVKIALRSEIVKDDSGSYAVCTEQGSPASQMTASKIMDIISRLPGCDGQAADAVSAYTQVTKEDAHKLMKIPKSECPDIWIRLPRHKWPKSWSSMEDPIVPLDWNMYGHPLLKLLWEKPCLNREFQQWRLKNFHALRIFVFLHGLLIWKLMPRNVWNGVGELAKKTTQQLYKVSTPRIDDHHFTEETKYVRKLSQRCSHIVLKCLYRARIGRPVILWSENKLARSITKWTKTCDKRLNRLISYIHQTCKYKQYCHVGKTAKIMQTWTVSRLWFCGRSWRFKIHFWRNMMLFWRSYICSNKLDVSETNFSFTIQQNPKSYLWTLDWDRTGFPL